MSEVKVISEVYDAVNDKNIYIALGTIERINIARINADGSAKITPIKRGPNAGNNMRTTHRTSILLKQGENTEWIGFGEHEVKNMNYEKQFQIKEEEKYVDLKEGMVIRLPVELQTWEKDGEKKSAYKGKRGQITIKDKSGAREPSQQSTGSQGSQSASTATGTAGGKTTKVYGEVVAIADLEASVKTDGGVVRVVLTAEEVSQIEVGGRLTGQRAEDGKIVSGFKAYGPVGQSNNTGSGNGKGVKKDNTGMEIGHAINGALNLRRSGLEAPVVEIAKVVHDVTKNLKVDTAKDPAHKGLSDYDLGAMVGHAVLNATRDIVVASDDNPEVITGKLLEYSRELIASVVPGVTAYVKGENLQSTANSQSEPSLQGKQEEGSTPEPLTETGHVDYSQEPMDFDDDIPF